MFRITRLLALVALLAAASASVAEPRRLVVMHLNDSHSHLAPFSVKGGPEAGGFARIAAKVATIRASGAPSILLHGGDAIVGSADDYLDRLRPDWARLPTYGWRGLDDVAAMNAMGFDAMVLGNHEFDFGRRWLEGLMSRASFPMLSANVSRRDLPRVEGRGAGLLAAPFATIERGGLRVGVVGLTTQEFQKSTQVLVEDPIAVAASLVPRLGADCDLVVVLSHLGLELDLELARRVPGIDLIVGGHTHDRLSEPRRQGRTLVVQAGSLGRDLGVLELLVDGGAVLDWSYRLEPIGPGLPEESEVAALVDRYSRPGEAPGGGLPWSREGANPLGAFACECLLEATGADVALFRSGAIVAGLPGGMLRAEDFFEAFWPYRPRAQGPQKDLDETQLLQMAKAPRDRLLRSLVGSSDGLRSVALVELPSGAVAAMLASNDALRGTDDYLRYALADGVAQPSIAAEAAEAGTVLRVALTVDVLQRSSMYGFDWSPEGVSPSGYELFEAVAARLGGPAPARLRAAHPPGRR